MTTPAAPDPDAGPAPQEDTRGVEIGVSEDAGGTFEPEEDPDDADSPST